MSKKSSNGTHTTKLVVPVEKKGYSAGPVAVSDIVVPAGAEGPGAGVPATAEGSSTSSSSSSGDDA